jgi:hypothetical protein
MAIDWESSSEIVAGLLLMGKLAPHSVNAEYLFPPYNEIAKKIQEGDSKEHIISKVGINPIQVAIDASKSLNGLSSANWIQILEETAVNYDAGTKLEKFAKKLQKGEDVDWSSIHFIATNAQENRGGNFVPLSEIEAMEVPFKETGLAFLDNHLGGLPSVGQVIVAAPPGTGKTTFMAVLAGSWVKRWKTEKVAIFTLEMVSSELKMRFQEVQKLNSDEQSRILLNDEPYISPEDIVSKASTIDNLGLVAVDFADLLIDGETTESSMAHIYRVFMLGAKKLGVPILVLGQLNRNYNGGLPRPNNIRYTGLAEALAWMILMLYNPSKDWFSDESNDLLPALEGKAYVLCWKCRGGFRIHKNDSPGAIQVDFNGSMGWRHNLPGKWFSLSKVV